MYSPQPYPSGSISISTSLALVASKSSSDGSNSICQAIGISCPSNSVPDIAVSMMGDHRPSSQEPWPSSSAFAMFLGGFQVGNLGMSSLSALPPHHFVDPDRGEWRGAPLGDRIVAI